MAHHQGSFPTAFITAFGGAAARGNAAHHVDELRRRRFEGEALNGAFLQGLRELGWTLGRNMLYEYR